MLNVHAGGGLAMMRAAAEAATKAAKDLGVPRPICLGVTVLTSLDRHALDAETGVPATVESHVLRMAGLARQAGLDGCVASAREIGPLRLQFGKKFVIVTPGIRPAGGPRHGPPDPPPPVGPTPTVTANPRRDRQARPAPARRAPRGRAAAHRGGRAP